MDIYVYADWKGLAERPSLMGTLTVLHTKGHQVTSFAYSQAWLKTGQAQHIDPDLQFFAGPQYLSGEKANFGLFMDSSPDRWGKTLMDRREAILAREQKRKPRKLMEEDYLLGVYDLHRMGGLRFKTEENGNFQHDDIGLAAPPFTSLRQLEQASLNLEKDLMDDAYAKKWINMLIAPGASLGGARPKASVLDEKGLLWIAKFPSVKDTQDVGAWEMVVNDMAKNAGIDVAEGMIRKYNSNHHTYLSRRFDRKRKNERIHFASAMTLLGKSDGEPGSSYLDLAEFIIQQGAAVSHDLEQLWRRIVFFIAVKNTDDHLRNHGFLLTADGWQLSPAYDINPVYFGSGLSLNISDTDNSLSLELAMDVSGYFRLTPANAKRIITNTKKIVSGWKTVAAGYKIPAKQQDMMAPAFND